MSIYNEERYTDPFPLSLFPFPYKCGGATPSPRPLALGPLPFSFSHFPKFILIFLQYISIIKIYMHFCFGRKFNG